MPNYEVLITASAVVLVVDADNEEQATDIATDQISFGKFDMDDASIKEIITSKNLESSKRHASLVLNA